jgi:hypothetical protein
MGERPQEDNVVGDGGRVTISEAAALLGVHRNTIKNRLNKGMYSAEKVHTERGPTWMIDRNSLQDNTPSRATQTTSVGVPAEVVQQLAREIVREAGLAHDPEKEAAEERCKDLVDASKRNLLALIDFHKHMTTLISASIVGEIAVTGAFRTDIKSFWIIYVSLGILGVALAISGISFGRLSRRVGRRTLGAEYFRDWTLEELLENARVQRKQTDISTLFSSFFWYFGLGLFIIGLSIDLIMVS